MFPSDYLKIGWCKGFSAINTSGKGCFTTDPNVVGYCLLGAGSAACKSKTISSKQAELLNDEIAKHIKTYLINIWNDKNCTGQSEAVSVMLAAEKEMWSNNWYEVCI